MCRSHACASGPRRRNSPSRSRPDPSACGSPRRPGRRDVAPSAPAWRQSARRHAFPSASGTPFGGGGGATPIRFPRIHLPRIHRRGAVGIRRNGQNTALPQQAAAMRILVQVHAAEACAVDVGNSVVLGQPLVEVGVLRAQQVEHAAVLPEDVVRGKVRSPAGTPAADCRRSRRRSACRDWSRQGCAGTATGPRSSSPACATGRPRACGEPVASSTPGARSLFWIARSSSSSSGMLLHRKNESRDANSTSLILIRVFGAMPFGSCSMRNRNSGLTSTARSPMSMPSSNDPPARACL